MRAPRAASTRALWAAVAALAALALFAAPDGWAKRPRRGAAAAQPADVPMPPYDGPPYELLNMRADLEEMEAQAKKLVDRVVDLTEVWGRDVPPADIEARIGERDGLRQRLSALLDDMNTRGDRLGVQKNAWQQQLVAVGMTLLAGNPHLTEVAGRMYSDAGEIDRFVGRISNFHAAGYQALKAEENAFSIFQRNREQRRQQARAMIAGGVGLLLVGGAFLAFYARRVRRIEAQITSQALAAPPQPVGLLAMGASPSPPPPIGPGATLGGNYRLEKELGVGGMGIVYEATDLTLGRKVAVKRMRREIAAETAELDLFMREARLVAALQHPNIVQIHSVIKEGEEILLVFELVPGQPLDKVITQLVRIPLPATQHVVRQVAAALDCAHTNKIIHRDLKPSNIMVNRDGVTKVMDFGIAHQAKRTMAKATRTAAWGTMAYMAPEQELGEVSAQSDIFALGAVVYEMLTGVPAFTGPNFLAQKQGKVFAALSKVLKAPPEIDALVSQAMDPDPAKRFATAGRFAASFCRAYTQPG